MDNEMNVSLGLETKDYERSLQGALKVFNSFQNQLNDVKLGFNSSQTRELHKIFSDIRTTAITELNKIQKRMDILSSKGLRLDISYDSIQADAENLRKEIEVTWRPSERRKLQAQLESLEAKLKNLDGEIIINDTEMEKAKQDYDTLLRELQVNPLEFDFEYDSLIKFNSQIDNVVNGLKRTGEAFASTKDEARKLGKETERVHRSSTKLNLMGRMFSQMRNTIAAAINPLNNFRKLWNKIIMTDGSNFANTFKNIGANIIDYLTPAFQKLAQWIINLLGYINIFLKALTGGKSDLFKKSASSAKSMAKSAKEASKSLAGFDEITDISESSGGGGGDSGALGGLVEPKLKGEWVKKLEEWGEKLKESWSKITDFWDTLKKNIGSIALVALSIIALIGLFVLLSKTLGTVTGPLLSIGVALVGIAAVIFSITQLLVVLNETGTSVGDLALIMASTLGILAAAVVVFAAATKLIDVVGLIALGVIFAGLIGLMIVMKNLIVGIAESGLSAIDVLKTMATIFGSIIVLIVALTAAAMILGTNPLALLGVVAITAALVAILLVMEKVIPTILDALSNFFERSGPTIISILDKVLEIIDRILDSVDNLVNNLLIPILVPLFTNISNFIKDMITNIGVLLGKIGEFFKGVKEKIVGVFVKGGEIFKGLTDGLLNICKTIINAIIKGANTVISLPFKSVNGLLNKIRNISFLGISPFRSLWKQDPLPVPKIPTLNVGTEYVPQDMLAVIHEGEAVIPREFNDKSYFSNNGNSDETNRLLNELIERVDAIEFNPYIRVRDIGEAATTYINSESRVKGRSVIN